MIVPEIPPTEKPSSTPACAMRVADEIKVWQEGEALVFDDSFEHEVWHHQEEGSERVVLLFDVWHPDLNEAEKQAIIEMFDESRRKGWLS